MLDGGAGSVRYTIEVEERIARAFDVEASSSKEAMARIARLYLDEGIVVESDAAPTVTFRVVEGIAKGSPLAGRAPLTPR